MDYFTRTKSGGRGGSLVFQQLNVNKNLALFKFLLCHAYYGRFLSSLPSPRGHKTAVGAPGTLSPEEKGDKSQTAALLERKYYSFSLYLTGQNCKTRVPLAAREAWDVSLGQRELCVHERSRSIPNATGNKTGTVCKMESEKC